MTFNKKAFGDFTTIDEAITALSGPDFKAKRWPVQLTNPVVNPANANGGSTGSPAGGAASDNDDPVFPHMDRAACLGECQTDIDLPACCI